MNRKCVIGYAVAASVAMIVFMVYGVTASMPDNVYIRHGLPFTWGRHQMATIAGPVDTWTVELNAMLGDLMFWSAVTMTGPLMLTKDKAKEQPRPPGFPTLKSVDCFSNKCPVKRRPGDDSLLPQRLYLLHALAKQVSVSPRFAGWRKHVAAA